MEVRMQFPGQDGIWLLISASPVEYESEPAFMVSLNNITRRKKVELALEHERKNLTERVKERDTLQAVLELTAKKTTLEEVPSLPPDWQYSRQRRSISASVRTPLRTSGSVLNSAFRNSSISSSATTPPTTSAPTQATFTSSYSTVTPSNAHLVRQRLHAV